MGYAKVPINHRSLFIHHIIIPGDAQLRYATVNMFFDVEEDVEHLCGLSYVHQDSDSMAEGCPCVPLHRIEGLLDANAP